MIYSAINQINICLGRGGGYNIIAYPRGKNMSLDGFEYPQLLKYALYECTYSTGDIHAGCRIIHKKKNADLAIFLVNQRFSCMHYFSFFFNSRMIFIKCIYEIPRQALKNTYSIFFFKLNVIELQFLIQYLQRALIDCGSKVLLAVSMLKML